MKVSHSHPWSFIKPFIIIDISFSNVVSPHSHPHQLHHHELPGSIRQRRSWSHYPSNVSTHDEIQIEGNPSRERVFISHPGEKKNHHLQKCLKIGGYVCSQEGIINKKTCTYKPVYINILLETIASTKKKDITEITSLVSSSSLRKGSYLSIQPFELPMDPWAPKGTCFNMVSWTSEACRGITKNCRFGGNFQKAKVIFRRKIRERYGIDFFCSKPGQTVDLQHQIMSQLGP